MNQPPGRRFPFAKIVVIFACTFGISLGLCGLSAFAGGLLHGFSSKVPIIIGIAGGALFFLSAIGLVVSVIAWVIAGAIGGFNRKTSGPQQLFRSGNDSSNNPQDRP
jgi:hypothetical protein